MTELAISVATGVLTAAATAMLTAIVKMTRATLKRQRAEDLALEAILRRMIIEAWVEHVADGEPMGLDRQREIQDMSEAYFGLGGNGTAQRQVAELLEIRPRVKSRG